MLPFGWYVPVVPGPAEHAGAGTDGDNMPAAIHPDPFEAWRWQIHFSGLLQECEMNVPWRASRE
eukprot:842913-Alexandrium_andersonii.AAC.1